MIKKMLMVFTLIMSFGFGIGTLGNSPSQHAYADTVVQPPTSIGTYNDFGKSIRLQWKPSYGAYSYNVYLAKGYNAQSGFVLQYNLSNYSMVYVNRQYWIRSYVSVPKLGWYTIRVTGVDQNGNESAPCTAVVNVIR